MGISFRICPLTKSFNRNIVECKVAPAFFSVAYKDVLIETLWNVKETLQKLLGDELAF